MDTKSIKIHSLFNWSSELGSHSIKFNKPDSYACPIQRFDDTGEELPVSIRKDGKYIKTIFKTPSPTSGYEYSLNPVADVIVTLIIVG